MTIPDFHGCEEWKIYLLPIRPPPCFSFIFSVMSTPLSSKNWYAFKVFFNKVFEIAELLEKSHIESYFPTETVVVVKNGKKKKELKPVISSLLFIKCTQQEVIEQQRLLTDRVILYTHFTEAGKVPAQIPNDEMERFKLVASSGQEGLEFYGNDCEEFHRGEHVRVIDGPFKGAEGYIRRVRHDHRLFVTVKGVCAVATSYIPRCHLQKIND